ncbi:MAG: hypothetical protein AAF525_14180 [Pseudomonadota bacterium]
MPVIDMSTLEPVGEFGSKAWGEACAEGAIRILQAANLPSSITWAFTEHYTHPPARLMEGGRDNAGYYVIVKEGKVTGGDGVTAESLAIPGFHGKLPWASICNQSAAKYGRAGQAQRNTEEATLFAAVEAWVGRKNPFGLDLDAAGEPNIMIEPAAPWPREVGMALGEGSEEGNGLHNIAATMQMDSPEFADLPVTELRVPIFDEMTEQQKVDFVKLCGIEM